MHDRYREIYVPSLIARAFRWLTRPLYGGHAIDAVTVGYTVYYLIPNPSPTLRRHEAEHVNQAKRMGRIRFWLAYLREYRRVGYWLNHYEVEARTAAERVDNDTAR